MTRTSMDETVWRIEAADEAATAALAVELAPLAKEARFVALAGDLGAGKSTFARALIRALMRDPALEAPSPTFTLMQSYEGPEGRILHADLYRLKDASELLDLGWEEETENALVLVEWPERAPDLLADDRLEIGFAFAGAGAPEAREIVVTGRGAVAARLRSFQTLGDFLVTSGWSGARREVVQGDASTRRYERLVKPGGERAILMISPARPDGPPVRFGKSYGKIAKLAEDIRPFVAVSEALRAQGLSAPRIFARNLEAGYAIVEDLGQEGVADENGPVPERYLEAARLLAHLHGRRLSDTLPVEGSAPYRLPPYDLDALLIEIELLLEWYAGGAAKVQIASSARASFINLWRQLLLAIAGAPPTWTLRDFHSPNLLWLPEREGIARVGLLDFQDCVMGHPAYDLVSLAQDARVAVPDELELKLLAHYARKRREAEPDFDMAGFVAAYAILGAQRATKVLGIFARLDARDGKPQYLSHLPRVEAYLRKNLRHPALAVLAPWYETHLPRLFAAA